MKPCSFCLPLFDFRKGVTANKGVLCCYDGALSKHRRLRKWGITGIVGQHHQYVSQWYLVKLLSPWQFVGSMDGNVPLLPLNPNIDKRKCKKNRIQYQWQRWRQQHVKQYWVHILDIYTIRSAVSISCAWFYMLCLVVLFGFIIVGFNHAFWLKWTDVLCYPCKLLAVDVVTN